MVSWLASGMVKSPSKVIVSQAGVAIFSRREPDPLSAPVVTTQETTGS